MWPKERLFDDAIVIGNKKEVYTNLRATRTSFVHDLVEPNELWHRRLAHVHYRALPLASKVVEGLPKMQKKHDGICKGCAKGKNTKEDISK